MISLVFATHNQHKLIEIQSKVAQSFLLKSLTDINCSDDIEETGLTLEENATLKSTYINQKFNVNCFADDTGLEIEALNNEPGVYSARYSGDRDFKKNMYLVLKNLEGKTNRKAQFRTVISLILENKEHVWHLFVVRCKKRDDLQHYLTANGIETLIHYPIPPNKQLAYISMNHLDYPITNTIHEEVLSLPISSVMTNEEVTRVIAVVNEFEINTNYKN